jgi:hypothetical protein
MNHTQQRIEEIKKNGYQLDFSNVFNHAFENYKKIALYAGLVLFVFSILLGVFGSGIVISIFGVEKINKQFIEDLQFMRFSGDSLIIYVACLVLLAVIMAPFGAGFLKMADCADKDEEFNVITIFHYYKMPYLLQICIASLIISFVSITVSTIMEKISFPSLGTVISLAITFFTYLTIPLIIFGQLKAIDAIKTSFMLVTKQPLTLVGLLITAFLASMVGFVGCCIGVIFTIPFTYAMNYAIYCAIIGVDSMEEIGEYKSKPNTFL